jgi:hypothetical protein
VVRHGRAIHGAIFARNRRETLIQINDARRHAAESGRIEKAAMRNPATDRSQTLLDGCSMAARWLLDGGGKSRYRSPAALV